MAANGTEIRHELLQKQDGLPELKPICRQNMSLADEASSLSFALAHIMQGPDSWPSQADLAIPRRPAQKAQGLTSRPRHKHGAKTKNTDLPIELLTSQKCALNELSMRGVGAYFSSHF